MTPLVGRRQYEGSHRSLDAHRAPFERLRALHLPGMLQFLRINLNLVLPLFAFATQEVYVNGVSQGHTEGIRVPTYDGPITDVNSNDIICNGGINPYRQPVSKKVIEVPAGAQVTAEWHHTLEGAQAGNPADPIDPSHKGPVLVYLAQIPDATQSSVTGLKWFKIYHDGLDSSGQWGVDRLIKNKGKVTYTIPSCIPAGQYLMRVELIALHGASNYPGAQFYMECAQLRITGGGNTNPPTVSFPGAYKGTDPGVRINIYSGVRSYTIPGPEVFTCAAGSGPTQTAAPQPQPTNPAPTQTSTTVVNPAPTSPSGPTVPAYGQCGGQGFVHSVYTGSTNCVAGTTCTKLNDWSYTHSATGDFSISFQHVVYTIMNKSPFPSAWQFSVLLQEHDLGTIEASTNTIPADNDRADARDRKPSKEAR
ncbi:hypothetical protein NMY22_g151 [Coprinellus aureogranulatus]|nr:hypothetical protein NMY22_g151 [Coprinellus aureogranulatus]